METDVRSYIKQEFDRICIKYDEKNEIIHVKNPTNDVMNMIVNIFMYEYACYIIVYQYVHDFEREENIFKNIHNKCDSKAFVDKTWTNTCLHDKYNLQKILMIVTSIKVEKTGEIQTTGQKKFVKQHEPKTNKNEKELVVDYVQSQKSETNFDKFNKWSDKSKDIPFKSGTKCVGNGEEKLAKELDISKPLGRQNSTIDLIHEDMGSISVKDMTNDDCTLGTEGCNNMRKIFRTIVWPFVCWITKYKSKCELANKIYNEMNEKYGSSRTTIINGIDRLELSKANISKLNEILNGLKKYKLEKEYDSLKSEYIDDIVNNLNDRSSQYMLNECVRKEATTMTLIIVDENKGWLIVKDINKISCPRITRGAPRINYS
jgi:hypothetical protein